MQNAFIQRRRGRRGTSLIEVLVVLVVLVVGILAISRLFPAGFLSLRAAENNSYAVRLAQGALDVLKQNNASLADGIYMYRADGYFDPTYAPDNLKPYATDTTYNDINKARYISNETVTVPAATSGSAFGLYVLNFGPYEPGTLTVNGTLWTAKNGDSRLNPSDPSGTATLDNPVDILQIGQQIFLVDLGGKNIAVPPAAYVDSTGSDLGQEFVASVQTVSAIGVQNTTNVAFTIPTAKGAAIVSPAGGNWFNLAAFAGLTSTSPVVADTWTSIALYRPFAQVASTGSYGTDPYQYALYNPSGGPVSMNTLAFNPLAGGRSGVSPLQARLSYSTQDWHILHEDRDVPTIATGDTTTLRLALSGLKKSGDIQFDQTLFNGLGNSGYDIMLLDRDDGTFYGLTGSGTTQNALNTDDNSGPTAAGTIGVSYLNGRITLPASFSGKHLRVFYSGVADWAVAVQKAPKSYVMNVSDLAGPLDTGYVISPPVGITPNRAILDLIVVGGIQHKRIGFPRCDAGKMVQLTISSYSDTVATGAKSYGGQPPLSIPIPEALDSSGVQFVDVSSLLPSTGTIDPTSVKITVSGLSARAFVIWHERDQWKTRSIDTLLTHIE